jgi:hypothetical protein
MNELSSRAQQLIALARRQDDPNLVDQNRIGQALAKQLGVGILTLAVGGTVSKGAAKATLAAGWSKLMLITTVGVAAALVLGQSPPEPVGIGSKSTQPAQVQHPPKSHLSLPASSAASGSDLYPGSAPWLAQTSAPSTSSQNRNHSIDATHRRIPAAGSVALAEPAEAANPGVDPLLAETAALREAQRALRAGDPNRAISLVDLQDRQYPTGTLTQERAATRIFALCALGQVAQASKLARAFERRWPRSPMLTRVQNSCGDL